MKEVIFSRFVAGFRFVLFTSAFFFSTSVAFVILSQYLPFVLFSKPNVLCVLLMSSFFTSAKGENRKQRCYVHQQRIAKDFISFGRSSNLKHNVISLPSITVFYVFLSISNIWSLSIFTYLRTGSQSSEQFAPNSKKFSSELHTRFPQFRKLTSQAVPGHPSQRVPHPLLQQP